MRINIQKIANQFFFKSKRKIMLNVLDKERKCRHNGLPRDGKKENHRSGLAVRKYICIYMFAQCIFHTNN